MEDIDVPINGLINNGRESSSLSAEELKYKLIEVEKQLKAIKPVKPCKEASALTNKELFTELEARDQQPSGFWSEDIKLLQEAYEKEHETEKREQEAEKKKIILLREALLEVSKEIQQKDQRREQEQSSLAKSLETQFLIHQLQDVNVKQPISAKLTVDPPLCRVIASFVSMNSNLQCLDLSQSNIGDEAGQHFAQALRSNQTLLKVELESANLGPRTAEQLGYALKTNCTLVYLSLENNPLTCLGRDYTGIETFVNEGLLHNTTLHYLNLWKTGLGIEGGRILAAAMCSGVSESLTSVMISGNEIAIQEEQRIARQLDLNCVAKEDKQCREKRHRAEQLQFEQAKKAEKDRERKIIEEDEWLERRKIERAEERQKLKEENEKREKEEQERKIKEMEEAQQKLEEEKAKAEARKKKKRKSKKKK